MGLKAVCIMHSLAAEPQPAPPLILSQPTHSLHQPLEYLQPPAQRPQRSRSAAGPAQRSAHLAISKMAFRRTSAGSSCRR